MVEIKHPELGEDVGFDGIDAKGNPVRYRIHTHQEIGLMRTVTFNQEMIRCGYGYELSDIIASQIRQRKAMNELRFVDAAVELNNNLERLGDLNGKRDPHLMACALFICRENEDRTKIPTDAERATKIEHWNNAGIPHDFFVGALKGMNASMKAIYEAPIPTMPLSAPPKGKSKSKAPFGTRPTSSKSTMKT